MADCPLADDCPKFSERITGMGCTHYGDRGGKEWCNQYNQPIDDLKTQPVKRGEEVVVDVVDMHESGAGVGRTDDGFIVMIDGILPEARARAEITRVHSNHARADVVERLPLDGDDDDDDDDDDEPATDDDDESEEASDEEVDDAEDADDGEDRRRRPREQLGSRENFWGS
ncbi:TRAM domain-containing protein [Natronosalvus vescus]|uniref:TRAM domain-containing protein n=1 Tax=Natronosalvus vescus TaxID=2953881 RepID=UPI0020916618|nr:TRAM domain-containing protein [Natronosalvus vescus]